MLERLLGYELKSSSRYRRFASLVMVSPSAGNMNLGDLLKDTIRDSDEFLEFFGMGAILMGETDSVGAMVAVNRYKMFYNGDFDLRYAVVSYPFDGKDAKDLLGTARQRMNQAKAMYPGAVVGSG